LRVELLGLRASAIAVVLRSTSPMPSTSTPMVTSAYRLSNRLKLILASSRKRRSPSPHRLNARMAIKKATPGYQAIQG